MFIPKEVGLRVMYSEKWHGFVLRLRFIRAIDVFHVARIKIREVQVSKTESNGCDRELTGMWKIKTEMFCVENFW